MREEVDYKALEDVYSRFRAFNIDKDFSRIKKSVETTEENIGKIQTAMKILEKGRERKKKEEKKIPKKMPKGYSEARAIIPVNSGIIEILDRNKADLENISKAAAGMERFSDFKSMCKTYEEEFHSILDNKKIFLEFNVEAKHAKETERGFSLGGEYTLTVRPYSPGKHLALCLKTLIKERYPTFVECLSNFDAGKDIVFLDTSANSKIFDAGYGTKHLISKEGIYSIQYFMVVKYTPGLIYGPNLSKKSLERAGGELQKSEKYLNKKGIYFDFRYGLFREIGAIDKRIEPFSGFGESKAMDRIK